MPRKITKAKIDWISLVPKGANRMPVLYKEDGDSLRFETLVKDALDEKGLLYAVVYAPNQVDSQGEFADAEVIEKMAHGFLADGKGVDVRHNEKKADGVSVVESFLIQKGDPRFSDMKDTDGNAVDVTGGWGVAIKIDNEDLRAKYRSGEWGGVSMGGVAVREVVEKEDAGVAVALKALARMLGLSRANAYQSVTLSGDIDMTPEDLRKELDARDAKLTESITKSITDALKPKTEDVKKDGDKPAPPVFKGDYGKPEDVEAFRKECAEFKILSEVDKSNPESVAKAAEEIAKIRKSAGSEQNRSQSNQPLGWGDVSKGGEESDEALFKKGAELAKSA